MPGPLPKRSAERRRRNKVPGETVVRRAGEVKPAPLPKDLHVVARRWYNSLKVSGQSEFFEPSDWMAAVYVAQAMSKNLKDERFSSMLFVAVWSAMDDLLTTESSRRRARIEIEHALEEEPEGPTAIDKYKARLAGNG